MPTSGIAFRENGDRHARDDISGDASGCLNRWPPTSRPAYDAPFHGPSTSAGPEGEAAHSGTEHPTDSRLRGQQAPPGKKLLTMAQAVLNSEFSGIRPDYGGMAPIFTQLGPGHDAMSTRGYGPARATSAGSAVRTDGGEILRLIAST